ncbi:MAG: oxidoreductase-like domain-containing protein [Lysobacter sp.]
MEPAESASTPPAPCAPTPDPPPRPPEKPLPYDCCESGCERCVYDIYADELAHYLSALTAWRARNPDRDPRAN